MSDPCETCLRWYECNGVKGVYDGLCEKNGGRLPPHLTELFRWKRTYALSEDNSRPVQKDLRSNRN